MSELNITLMEESRKWHKDGESGLGISYTDDAGKVTRDAVMFAQSDTSKQAAAKLRSLAEMLERIE